MANEAVLVYETELPIPFTCSDSATIEKGALCQLTDPMTASLASAINQMIAGIAAEEKVVSNGQTKVPIYRAGIFKMIASGAITFGVPLTSCAVAWPNYVCAAGITASGSQILGHALETAAAGETFLVDLHIAGGGAGIA